MLGNPPGPTRGDEGLPDPEFVEGAKELLDLILGICGAPCLPKWNARIFASISGGSPPLLDSVDWGGPGLRAALTLPRGVEEDVILGGGFCGPFVRFERD